MERPERSKLGWEGSDPGQEQARQRARGRDCEAGGLGWTRGAGYCCRGAYGDRAHMGVGRIWGRAHMGVGRTPRFRVEGLPLNRGLGTSKQRFRYPETEV